jgi:hypothetical protein
MPGRSEPVPIGCAVVDKAVQERRFGLVHQGLRTTLTMPSSFFWNVS